MYSIANTARVNVITIRQRAQYGFAWLSADVPSDGVGGSAFRLGGRGCSASGVDAGGGFVSGLVVVSISLEFVGKALAPPAGGQCAYSGSI